MPRYAIYAYEGIYQGLHGINEREVIEADDIYEAMNYAEDMSCEVIEQYGVLEDRDFDLDNGQDFMDLYMENVCYTIYEIIKGKDLSIEELDSLFNKAPDSFIKKYCSQENKTTVVYNQLL